MNIRAILRRRSTWIAMIVGAVVLGVGQWSYSRWRDEWMGRELVGRWLIRHNALAFDLHANGICTDSTGLGLSHWWVEGGVLYICKVARSARVDRAIALEYRIKRLDRRSLVVEGGARWPTFVEVLDCRIQTGRSVRLFGQEQHWERIEP